VDLKVFKEPKVYKDLQAQVLKAFKVHKVPLDLAVVHRVLKVYRVLKDFKVLLELGRKAQQVLRVFKAYKELMVVE
jgi:hypothetical protein